MTDLRRLADHIAITQVIQQVAQGFDEKRHDELLPRAFTADATIIYYLRGLRLDFSMPGGLAMFKYYHDRCWWTQHLVSPQVLGIDGDSASASTPVHAVHVQIREDGSRSNWLIGATYHDALVRTPDGWRIRMRTAACGYVEGDFLSEGVKLFPSLPTFEQH